MPGIYLRVVMLTVCGCLLVLASCVLLQRIRDAAAAAEMADTENPSTSDASTAAARDADTGLLSTAAADGVAPESLVSLSYSACKLNHLHAHGILQLALGLQRVLCANVRCRPRLTASEFHFQLELKTSSCQGHRCTLLYREHDCLMLDMIL